ncbi:Brp/Blh family beta-carotene 15,15'-dioxygenase [Sphingomonas sp. BN140010]|uniref:Probable beta-carotene 15,15'-dioxygenase n=1 Tax=Sphingomonas arvum TaxID=2992113 RepID=A0ABT3JDI0_9SPHN|nr:Brp/Blh family beta-carotene 15,15'-dioxygenase [Sphingomonas sp. BN140010]MCW3797101.1 Brp/Blh family beta-carotene 15,15'-dioxygenase [Sphingomonas sp. BN140010]
MSLAAQLPWLAVAVFLIGTPHGALDHRLGRQLLAPGYGRWWGAVFVLLYLAVSAAALGVWLATPVLALALFLGIAAVHFGEHDSPSGHPLAIAVRGLAGPVVAAAAHPGELKLVFEWIAGEGGTALVPWLGGPGLLAWLCGAAAVLVLEPRPAERLELVAVTALFAFAPPLLAFAAYFALLHTPRALKGSKRPGESWSALLRSAAPLSGAAVLLGIVGFLLWRDQMAAEAALVRTTFWWLGALTVPHMGLALLAKRTSPTAAARSAPGLRRSAAAG